MVDKNDSRESIQSGRLRLTSFEVEGLYREFNYSIPLDIKRHVTAIIAPNGSGKTLCLRLINALFNNDWLQFERTDFRRVIFRFNDGTVIQASKPQAQLELDEDDTLITSLQIEVFDGSGRRFGLWRPHQRKNFPGSVIDQYLPYLVRNSKTTWLDRRSAEVLTFSEILETYAHEIPQSILRKVTSQQPEYLSNVLKQINCKLIETQRLIILNEQEESRSGIGLREGKRTQFAISRKASTLKDIISREMNRYAALSQSLDRTFPARVISEPPRLCRRPFGLSYAATAGSSSMA